MLVEELLGKIIYGRGGLILSKGVLTVVWGQFLLWIFRALDLAVYKRSGVKKV